MAPIASAERHPAGCGLWIAKQDMGTWLMLQICINSGSIPTDSV